MLTEVIILAGGFGTRLKSVVNDVPKPMAPVNDEPFLNFIFDYLKHYNIEQVVLSTGYLAEKIFEYYKNQYNGIKIFYTKEDSPLGTGGGIRLALEKCKSKNVLVLNGDSFFDINLTDYYNRHTNSNSNCSLALRKVSNASRYGTIHLSENNIIEKFNEKDDVEKQGLINGGVYIINREFYMSNTIANSSFSIEKDFYETKINELTIFGFQYDGYFIDIGIPQDYKKAQNDFKEFKYR